MTDVLSPRFSVEPILALYEDIETVAYVFGVHKRTVLRWKSGGIDWKLADRLACKAGFNPMTLWGAEWDAAANGANATLDDDAWYAEWLADGDNRLALL
jgi:hypothetical protein